jgi:hypothetical protein
VYDLLAAEEGPGRGCRVLLPDHDLDSLPFLVITFSARS